MSQQPSRRDAVLSVLRSSQRPMRWEDLCREAAANSQFDQTVIHNFIRNNYLNPKLKSPTHNELYFYKRHGEVWVGLVEWFPDPAVLENPRAFFSTALIPSTPSPPSPPETPSQQSSLPQPQPVAPPVPTPPAPPTQPTPPKPPTPTPTPAQPTTRAGNGLLVIEPKRSEEFFIHDTPEFYDYANILPVIHHHFNKSAPILLVGPHGIGKTLAFAYFAKQNNIPIIQFDCSEDTTRSDLIGRFVLIGNEVAFVLGVLPASIVLANKYGKAILVFEELNTLTPQMQKVLNQLLDWRRHVFVPEIQTTYRLRDGAQLLIGATMNPSFYGGVYELNLDLRSRFAEYHLTYPTIPQERALLRRHFPNLPDDVIDVFVRLAADTRTSEYYHLSPRDLVNLIHLTVDENGEINVPLLQKWLFGRYNTEDARAYIAGRLESLGLLVDR